MCIRDRSRTRKDLGTKKPSTGIAWASDFTEQIPVILILLPSFQGVSRRAPDCVGRTTEKTNPPEDTTIDVYKRQEGEKGHQIPNVSHESELVGSDASEEEVVLAELR